GIVLLGFFNALYAFILVIRYDSLNSFLFPSAFYTMLLGVPILPYFNLWQSPLVYLHPVQPSLLLLKAGFHSIEGWQLGYAIAYGTGVVAVLFVWASRAFHQFVVIKRGGRR
ncbi:MAG: hypothetical protein KAG66_03960, partial [Methylococcales bacterium]|nr:hypothetical protein [Methylococcales bacterium]